MGKQQPIKHYIDDTGAHGKFSPSVREGQGSQISTHGEAGFRARKHMMHEKDGDHHLNDDESAFEKRPANEEKEVREGEKEFSGKTGREYKD